MGRAVATSADTVARPGVLGYDRPGSGQALSAAVPPAVGGPGWWCDCARLDEQISDVDEVLQCVVDEASVELFVDAKRSGKVPGMDGHVGGPATEQTCTGGIEQRMRARLIEGSGLHERLAKFRNAGAECFERVAPYSIRGEFLAGTLSAASTKQQGVGAGSSNHVVREIPNRPLGARCHHVPLIISNEDEAPFELGVGNVHRSSMIHLTLPVAESATVLTDTKATCAAQPPMSANPTTKWLRTARMARLRGSGRREVAYPDAWMAFRRGRRAKAAPTGSVSDVPSHAVVGAA
jgi:hypothetical protein